MKNKFKSHNHPLSRLLLLLIFTLLFIISCRKNEEIILKKDKIKEAQEWFNSKTINQNLNTSMFRSKGINKLSTLNPQSFPSTPANADHTLNIDWENAKQYQSNDSTIIEVPVSTKGIFKFNTEPASDKKISINKSFTRVLFIETALKTEGYFMTIISSDSYLAKNGSNPYNNSYLRKESGFEGTIVYHDLSGKMLNAFSINKLKQANKQASINPTPKDKTSIAIPDNCVGTPVYEVIGTDCYDVGAYYTYCENVYSIYLGSTGCGSGGGNTNPNAPGGGGAGGSGTSQNYEVVTYDPGIDLAKKLDCFKSVSDIGATYSAKLCADLPVNDNPNALMSSEGTGHAFIILTKTSGANSVTESFGFYPKNGIKSGFSINGFATPVESQVNNNGSHEYNASLEMNNISSSDFNAMINVAITLATTMKYDINDYNCTNYGLQVFNNGRDSNNQILISDWIGTNTNTNFGKTPNGLYKKIEAMKNSGNPNAKVSKANAPTSTICD